MKTVQKIHDHYNERMTDLTIDFAKDARRLAAQINEAADNAEKRAKGESSYLVGHMLDTRRLAELEATAREIRRMEEMVTAMRVAIANEAAAALAAADEAERCAKIAAMSGYDNACQ